MAKKKQLSADDVLAQMYPDLMTSDDFVEEKKEEVKADKTNNDAIAALQAQIAALNGQLASVSKANSALTTQATIDAPPKQPTFNDNDLPDPIDDRVGYTKAIMARNAALIQYEKDKLIYENRQQASAKQRQETLWSSFSTKYAPYAKNDKQVEIAATQVLNRLRSSGIDTDKYIATHGEDFMKDVVSEIDGLFGKPKDLEADDDNDDDDDDDRSEVFGGGVAGVTAGAGGKGAPPQKYGALGSALTAWQEKTGFHR